jgi:hypothetical protein
MDLKKIVGAVTKDKILGGAANRILPMEEAPKKLGWKAKLAGDLVDNLALADTVATTDKDRETGISDRTDNLGKRLEINSHLCSPAPHLAAYGPYNRSSCTTQEL